MAEAFSERWRTIPEVNVVFDKAVLPTDEEDANIAYWTNFKGGSTQRLDPKAVIDGKPVKQHVIAFYIEDNLASAKVLDLGCGYGRINLFYNVKEYWGYDVTPAMIYNAKLLNASKVNCHFVLGKGKSLREFNDNSFDFVICSTVMLHLKVSTVERYSTEVYRVLKPRGSFLVNFPRSTKLNILKTFRKFSIKIIDDNYFGNDNVFLMTKGEK